MEHLSEKAFEILIRQHHRRLLAYAATLCGDSSSAPDIVQDAFVTAYRNLGKFDVTRDFGAWLRGIVRNKCREWRRQQKFVAMDDELLEIIESQHRRWDQRESETGARLFEKLHACLQKLPELMSQSVNLFYLQNLSGIEVAQRLGIEEPALRKRLQRARQTLAECIEKEMRVE